MLCLSGFELYSRWVPLKDKRESKRTTQSERGAPDTQTQDMRDVSYRACLALLALFALAFAHLKNAEK